MPRSSAAAQDLDTASPTPEAPEAPEAPANLRRRDRIEVRESGVHGRSVYAVTTIAKGKKIIEYKGEHISWKEALRRHPHDPTDPNHTFYFSLEDGSVIDAKFGGNRARWINHACKPNCEAREKDGRVFIHAKRDIEPGEELFYDYGLVIEGRQTKALKAQFACHCGAKKCRGTMLAPPGKK
jgi:SET domain-containing protein